MGGQNPRSIDKQWKTFLQLMFINFSFLFVCPSDGLKLKDLIRKRQLFMTLIDDGNGTEMELISILDAIELN